MSRVKIVKEAGAKPTDFENTVAKVLRLFRCRRARRTVERQRSRRGDFVSEGNPTRALFCTRKMGLTRVNARSWYVKSTVTN